MITTAIPDFGDLELHHLVTDYNGTLALDGVVLSGVAKRLRVLAHDVTIHVITADTFGLACEQLEGLPVQLTIVPLEDQAESKLRYLRALGAETVVALGNGRNDRKMLAAAALGIAVIQEEGGAADTIIHADIIATSILDALDLLANPNRIKATLRS
jgi:soluble P-type ATPase